MIPEKIAIKTIKGIDFVLTEDILYCKALGRYTKLVLQSGKFYVLTRVLKDVEQLLPGDEFFRTHKSYLVNLNHIVQYQHHKEKPIILANDEEIFLSRRRKQEFQGKIREIVRMM